MNSDITSEIASDMNSEMISEVISKDALPTVCPVGSFVLEVSSGFKMARQEPAETKNCILSVSVNVSKICY